MKNIGIYFSRSGAMSYPFSIHEYYESYQELIKIIESDKGVKVYIVRGESYQGKGVFHETYHFENNLLVEVSDIKIDLIFNRCLLPEITDCTIINAPKFHQLCDDKYETFLKFSDISTSTKYIHNFSHLANAFHDMNIKNDELVVLKKNFNSGGEGVHILQKNMIQKDLYQDWSNVLVQKFIDSSVGIPHIVEGLHDLRVMVVNHKIVGAMIRTPKKGSYLANVSKGGASATLDIHNLPQDLFKVLEKVIDSLRDYENIIYGADFMNSPDGYKLIELNASPGLLHKTWDTNYINFYNAIAQMLLGAIKKI